MNPFGATLVLLLTARDAKRIAAASKLPRSSSADCGNLAPHHRCSSAAIRAAESFTRNMSG